MFRHVIGASLSIVVAAGTAWAQTTEPAAPRTAEEHFARAKELLEQKRRNEALIELVQAVTLKPDYASAYRVLGYLRQSLGDYAGALRDFDRYLDLYSIDAGALNARCWLKLERGDVQGAWEDCDSSLALEPGNKYALVNRGRALSRRGFPLEAFADYSVAIHVDPNYAVAYRNRGLVRKTLGDLDGAQRDFETAIQVDPGYARARQSLEQLKAERAATAPAPGGVPAPPALPPPPALESAEKRVSAGSIRAPEPLAVTVPQALPPPPAMDLGDVPSLAGGLPSLPGDFVQSGVDESRVLAAVRTVLSALKAYAAVNGRFAPELRCLVEPASCYGEPSPGVRLEPAVLEVERFGYRLQLHLAGDGSPLPAGAGDESAAVTALPLTAAASLRAFCGHVTRGGRSLLCSVPAAQPLRVEQGRCPASCLPLP